MESKERISKQKQNTGRSMALRSTCTQAMLCLPGAPQGQTSVNTVLISAGRIAGSLNGAQFFQMNLATTQLGLLCPKVMTTVVLTT